MIHRHPETNPINMRITSLLPLRLSALALSLTFAGCVPPGDKGSGSTTTSVSDVEEIHPKVTLPTGVFSKGRQIVPTVLPTRAEAVAALGRSQVEALEKEVDFSQQTVLIFAWNGSGQDQLDFSLQKSFPPTVLFMIQRGQTRDLRPHSRIFALRKGLDWEIQ